MKPEALEMLQRSFEAGYGNHDWVARDLFRVNFRAQESAVQRHAYDHKGIATMLLYTSHEVRLDDLINRPLESGDELS